jgi:hypothetical protein
MSPTDETYAADDDNAPAMNPQPAVAATTVGDGQPGVPVAGYPGLRAGVPGGSGALQLYRSGDDGASGAHLILTADHAPNDGASALPDYITKSQRWNDPDALAYELDRRQRQLGDAQALSLGSAGAGVAQQGIADLAKVAPGAEALTFASPLAWAGIGTGAYMGFVEAPRLQNQVDALRTRLNQLRGGSRT